MKKSELLKKALACLLVVMMTVTAVPFGSFIGVDIGISASAVSQTQDQAISWVRSKLGTGIDVDGYYGCQCVDLIMAYYDYLVGYHVSGNGCDYSWNSLPQGWTRVQGGRPQKGDILVYTNGTYGHVAIYESDYSHYHQNYNYHSYVECVTSHSYNWSGSGYWGYIRPNFSNYLGEMTMPTISIDRSNYYVGEKVNITWAATSSNTDFYQYWLVISNTTNNICYYGGATGDAGDVTKNSYTFTIPAEGDYQITVYAVPYNSKNTREKSAIKSFSAVSAYPAKPALSNISAQTGSDKVVFTWNPVKNATCYNLFIYSVSDTKNPVQSHWAIRRTTLTTTLPDGTYVARICSENETSIGNYYTDGDLSPQFSVKKVVATPKIASVSLSATKYIYDGKVKTPTVTVKDSNGKTLKNGTNYTVTYASGRKDIGQYAVKVTFKGAYTGSKTLYFHIYPQQVAKPKATQTTSSVTLSWSKVSGSNIRYYVFLYNPSTKKYKALGSTTGTSYTIKKLSSGTTYYYAVQAYSTSAKIWGRVSPTLITATKPGTPSLKVTAGTKKASLSWNKQAGATGYAVYMSTSKNGKYTRIATVNGSSKVKFTKTGLTKGKSYYFKVRAFKSAGGNNIYGSYSTVKSVKVK